MVLASLSVSHSHNQLLNQRKTLVVTTIRFDFRSKFPMLYSSANEVVACKFLPCHIFGADFAREPNETSHFLWYYMEKSRFLYRFKLIVIVLRKK